MPQIERNPVMFQVSNEFLQAIDEEASSRDISRAELMRQAVASFIDYDIDAEPKPNRQRIYASETERSEERRGG